MTVAEIFEKINSHMIEGIMLHDQMSEYYDFLDLHGFKRCHEYHAICEFKTRRKIVRYYINHFGKLLSEVNAEDPQVVPNNWRNYTRQEVDINTKKRAIRDGFAKWQEWEKETKKLYEKLVWELYSLGEIAAAKEISKLVKDVDHELKIVERKSIMLASIDYDLPSIYLEQAEIHKKYKAKLK